MKEFLLRVCLFLFLVVVFSGHTNELGVITGAVTGTILIWPLYRRILPRPTSKRKITTEVDEEPAEISGK